jgi:hypothetical protein
MQYRVRCEVDIYIDAESLQVAQEATRTVFLDDVLLFFRKGITKNGRVYSMKGLSGSIVNANLLSNGNSMEEKNERS